MLYVDFLFVYFFLLFTSTFEYLLDYETGKRKKGHLQMLQMLCFLFCFIFYYILLHFTTDVAAGI